MSPLSAARLLAFGVPAVLLAGALGSEHLGGLAPCEMCHWQRWGHYAALGFALLSLLPGERLDRGRSFVWLAALAILTSGLIGAYHAGVEMQILPGLTGCSALPAVTDRDAMLAQILSAPLVRCDQVQWSLLGISMAGWNAILSIGSAIAIAWLSLRSAPHRAAAA